MPKIGAISGKEKKEDGSPLYPKDKYQKHAKGTWVGAGEIFGKNFLVDALKIFVFCLVILMISGIWLKWDLKLFPLGFLVIFILALLAVVLSKQYNVKYDWQISQVIFALCIGLLISNLFKVPKFVVAARQTEYYVKIGLVAMGAGILFGDVIRAGIWGVLQALFVAVPVWFMTYFICRSFKISERFSAIISTANSICGVSATIAAGGAIQGKPKEVSYMVAWVLVCAVVLILVMPPIAAALGLGAAWSGAWMGGVIDNTGAVIAAGESVVDEHAGRDAGQNTAANAASEWSRWPRMSSSGFAAFLMALWATMSLDKKEAGAEYGGEGRPSCEVWYRFPKFVIGFVVASAASSRSSSIRCFGEKTRAKAIGGETCEGLPRTSSSACASCRSAWIRTSRS